MDSDLVHDIVAGCIVLAAILTAVSILRIVRSKRPSKRRRTAA
jgi:hypothetical protein